MRKLPYNTDPHIWLGNTWGGDANFDGRVDISDLYILANHWSAFHGASARGWLDADFNADGLVDVVDLTVLAAHWQCGVGGTVWMSAETLAALLGLS